jgi:colicin import membrane protein
MKTCVIFIILSSLSFIGLSQSKKELQEQVTILTSEKQKLSDEKLKLMEDILNLKQQILDIKTENLNYKTENDQLRTNIPTNSNVSSSPTNQVVSKQSTSTNEASRERCLAITAKGTQCTRLADLGSKYCWQHKATYEPRNINSTTTPNKSSISSGTSSGTTSSGRTIYTGPRGGKYYINSNGNKTYIKR